VDRKGIKGRRYREKKGREKGKERKREKKLRMNQPQKCACVKAKYCTFYNKNWFKI